MTCEDRRDTIFLDAAGALDADERVELEAHLAGCELCRMERAAAEETLAELSLALDPVVPSADVKRRLLERVGQAAAGPAPAPVPARTGGWRIALAAGVAAVAAAALAAGLTARLGIAPARERAAALETARAELEEAQRALVEERDALREERDELQEALDEQDTELAALEEALDFEREVLTMLRHPDVEAVALTGTAAQPEARARVFWQWADYACYLHAEGLAPPEAGRTYALWLRTDAGDPIRVGTFEPDARGEVTFFAKLPKLEVKVVSAVVTDEPSEPGDAPSGAAQLEWQRGAPAS